MNFIASFTTLALPSLNNCCKPRTQPNHENSQSIHPRNSKFALHRLRQYTRVAASGCLEARIRVAADSSGRGNGSRPQKRQYGLVTHRLLQPTTAYEWSMGSHG